MFFMEPITVNNHLMLRTWSRDGIRQIPAPIRPYCFVLAKKDEKTQFKDAVEHQPLRKIEFEYPQEVAQYRGFRLTYESDVPYTRRVMLDMDWKIEDVPIAFVDIEVNDSNGFPKVERDPIVCIGIIMDTGERHFLHIDDFKGDEKAMIFAFMDLMKYVGIIVTYNGGTSVYETRSFDIPYIAGRYAKLTQTHEVKKDGEIVVKDGEKAEFDYALRHCAYMDMFQIYKAEHQRIGKSLIGGYSLENVSQHELGIGKLKHTGKMVHQMSKEELMKYCLYCDLPDGKSTGDCNLVYQLEKKLNFISMKIGLAQVTNSFLVNWNDKQRKKHDELKPLILIDQLVLKQARAMGLVMPDRKYEEKTDFQGAIVPLPAKVGLHKHVQNYDIKSMYPSIIINEKISPDKDRVIVPTIIKMALAKREEYKAQYEKSNELSDYIKQYNYKVLANVFYGAFGNPASRVYSADLAGAVTRKGRSILMDIHGYCTDMEFDAIYGDTDSVFVRIPKDKAPILQKMLNDHLKPYKIGLGDHYNVMIFVEIRGGERAAKKRYAGIKEDGKIEIKGLEAVKSSYCDLARKVQKEVLMIVLGGASLDKPQDEIESAVKAHLDKIHTEVMAGQHDKELLLRISVKEDVNEYNHKTKTGKEHKGLPHIRAYKKWLEMGGAPAFEIQFVYTTNDVEPVMGDAQIPATIDRTKYWDSQIYRVCSPVIRAVLGKELYEKAKAQRKVRKPKIIAKDQATLF